MDYSAWTHPGNRRGWEFYRALSSILHGATRSLEPGNDPRNHTKLRQRFRFRFVSCDFVDRCLRAANDSRSENRRALLCLPV